MKKIMFNDKYGLTQAVLEGRKTITRRAVPMHDYKYDFQVWYDKKTKQCCVCDGSFILERSRYSIGEVVAIAQSYKTLANSCTHQLEKMLCGQLSMKKEYSGAGYKNKMFVKAELMPHQIKITNIEVEHLQDISDEDCLREGVYGKKLGYTPSGYSPNKTYYTFANVNYCFDTPREAFAELIDKVSGKGTWESNPYVWVYEFELSD